MTNEVWSGNPWRSLINRCCHHDKTHKLWIHQKSSKTIEMGLKWFCSTKNGYPHNWAHSGNHFHTTTPVKPKSHKLTQFRQPTKFAFKHYFNGIHLDSPQSYLWKTSNIYHWIICSNNTTLICLHARAWRVGSKIFVAMGRVWGWVRSKVWNPVQFGRVNFEYFFLYNFFFNQEGLPPPQTSNPSATSELNHCRDTRCTKPWCCASNCAKFST